ncbi:unnamed protein product, partial [Didymodactylos carnosus]
EAFANVKTSKITISLLSEGSANNWTPTYHTRSRRPQQSATFTLNEHHKPGEDDGRSNHLVARTSNTNIR